ncbi:unnamed protein product [Rotaria socialis]|uniref:C2H2-type domain-containing protein n=1 Tax=Rotaria socialis TaxID=392032 RepID=A0A820IQF4_9BILA|nr:unnamed protein product [Rotaria socialis]
MQHTSSTPPPLIENCQILPMSTTTISEISKSNDNHYTSLLLKKKLAIFDSASKNTTTEVSIANDTIVNPVSLIKPSSTTLSLNENEPVKSASRRRKPLRPWSLSARGERPNSNNCINHSIEPISDNDDDDDDDDDNDNQMEMKYSPVNHETTNSNMEESDDQDIEWPKCLSTIEEILKMYVETNRVVQCVRCGTNANQDNLLEHVSIHYPYKCYSCGFYCDSSSSLDEHNRTHTPSSQTKSIMEQLPAPAVPVSTSIKSSESLNGTNTTSNNSEKSTPPSKAKVHRCRQCSFVSSVKEDYWAHHRVHIRADKILECPSCPFVTEYKHHLEYHLRNHLGSKPFKCSKCDYACLNDFIAPYQQFLTQQIQSHLSSTSVLSSMPTSVHSYHLDNNNNHAPAPPSLLNGGYSLLSSCIKNESNENHLPSSKLDTNVKRQRKGQAPFKYSADASHDEHSNEFINRHDQQTQVDECQIKRLFECFHCEIIFKDFAMYCTHKQLHYSPDNPFRCAQCGEQKANKYDFFVHVAQQAHELT